MGFVPTTVLGVLLFVVLLAPGFAHALVKERRSPRQVFSAFRETVSLVLVSIVADMVLPRPGDRAGHSGRDSVSA